MKKMNNKGFSLVELIIVIAIMAILAAAIAPALIRYIDKSRKSNDLTAAKTIKTAADAAMANEAANSEVLGAATAGSRLVLAKIANGQITDEVQDGKIDVFISEFSSNLGKAPGISYKKDGASTFVVALSSDRNSIEVWLTADSINVSSVAGSGSKDDSAWMLQPTIHDSYK